MAVPPSLFAISTVFACAYAMYGLFRHWRFGSSAYDLGIFDQALWHLSRFEAPASTISGFANILGDHFYPVIALFAPLYWIAPAPETLIVAQAALLGASIIPVFLFLRDRPSLPAHAATALTVAYGLFWGIQQTAAFDVHEMAFAPLLIAVAILALDRRWPLFWGAAAALILVKEDLIPLLAGFGLYLLARGEKARGAGLVVASVGIFAFVTAVIVPAFNDAGTYAYSSLYQDFLARPWTILTTLVTPLTKVETAVLWLAPFLFLSLASPLCLLIVPLALERFLSPLSQHWGTVFHYSAPLAPIIAMSAGDGLARLARWTRQRGSSRTAARFVAVAAAASVVLSSVLPGNQPLWRLFTRRHYQRAGTHAAATEALALVPDNASVVAQAAIVPHLSRRDRVFMLDSLAPDAEFVVAAAGLSPWPARAFDELQALLDDRRQRGYNQIFNRDGWTVLRLTRVGSGSTER